MARGVKAGAVVKIAAPVGGGGGGRDNMAQAGGQDPDKLPDALEAARTEIERRAARAVLALDYGSARCGVAVVTRRARSRRRSSRSCVRDDGGASGLRRADRGARGRAGRRRAAALALGRDSAQTIEIRAFAERLSRSGQVPVELYDERFTTKLAQQPRGADG